MRAPSISLISVLLLVGAGQGFFFAFLLARMRTGNHVANRFLALLLLVFSFGLIDGFMSVTYYYLRYPSLIGIQWPLMAAYGPLVYFYIKSLTEPWQRIEPWRLLPHFLPAAIFAASLAPFFLLNADMKGKQWLLESVFKNYSGVANPMVLVFIIQIAGYLILSFRILLVHSRAIKQNYSSIERINLSWLRNLVVLFMFQLGIFSLVTVLLPAYGIFLQGAYFYNLTVVGIIYIMGYKGISQTKIFTTSALFPPDEAAQTGTNGLEPVEATTMQEEGFEAGKYAKSSLSDEQADTILSGLTQLMEKEKPHLEMGLTLPMLSKMLEVSPNHLSQVINGKLSKSFFDFVNRYRVEETKKALISPESDRFSILGIAMDAGFNSKSSFYTAFKKHTGMTPSQFKERLISRDYPA